MKKLLLFLSLVILPMLLSAQFQGSRSVWYFDGVPTFVPDETTSPQVAYDRIAKRLYFWDMIDNAWIADTLGGGGAGADYNLEIFQDSIIRFYEDGVIVSQDTLRGIGGGTVTQPPKDSVVLVQDSIFQYYTDGVLVRADTIRLEAATGLSAAQARGIVGDSIQEERTDRVVFQSKNTPLYSIDRVLRKEGDVNLIFSGNSITARDFHTTYYDSPATRPPLFDSRNIASLVYDALSWNNDEYRRYDSGIFTETGAFVTVTTNPNDTPSNGINSTQWADFNRRPGHTRMFSGTGTASVAWSMGSSVNLSDFIYRTDLQGSQTNTVTISGGTGRVQVLDGPNWVEAHGYTFSMRQVVSATRGNSKFNARLKFRCSDGAGFDSRGSFKIVTITKSDTSDSRFMYWGTQYTDDKVMFRVFNAGRGGLNFTTLAPFVDDDIFDHITPGSINIVNYEIPINEGQNTATPSYQFLIDRWYTAFYDRNNPNSLRSRAELNGNDWENFQLITWNGHPLVGSGAITATNTKFTIFDHPEDGLKTAYDNYQVYAKAYEDSLAHPGHQFINVTDGVIRDAKDRFGVDWGTAFTSSGITGNTYLNDITHPNDLGAQVFARVKLNAMLRYAPKTAGEDAALSSEVLFETNGPERIRTKGANTEVSTLDGQMIARKWSGGDIAATVQRGNALGWIIEGYLNTPSVISIRDSDPDDNFSVISGGGDYSTNTTYDMLVLQAMADGRLFLPNLRTSTGDFAAAITATGEMVKTAFPADVNWDGDLKSNVQMNGFALRGSTQPGNFGLFVDGADRVGINDATPTNALHVLGGASIGFNNRTAPTNGLMVEGNLSVGTFSNAGFRLDLNYENNATTGLSNGVRISNTSTTLNTYSSLYMRGDPAKNDGHVLRNYTRADNNVDFGIGRIVSTGIYNERLTILNDGSISTNGGRLFNLGTPTALTDAARLQDVLGTEQSVQDSTVNVTTNISNLNYTYTTTSSGTVDSDLIIPPAAAIRAGQRITMKSYLLLGAIRSNRIVTTSTDIELPDGTVVGSVAVPHRATYTVTCRLGPDGTSYRWMLDRGDQAGILTASATLDFPGIAAMSDEDETITVTGAAVGDVVAIGVPASAMAQDITYFAWVSAANTVTVRVTNHGAAIADPASGTFTVKVLK